MSSTMGAERAQATSTSPARKSGPRRDIQGLRAFAVLAVVFDHLLGWPRGGFVGVDIFFVISGFLITGLLLRERDETDTISWLGFYRRRVKRIIPAAVLVLVVTVAASWLVFDASRFKTTVTDGIWAFFFAGNWRFASLSTDYFTADAAVSPLQHFWSLAVEEQFYFVWPWVMLAALAIVARRSTSADVQRLVVGGLITVITIASFAWALAETASNPNLAYFSTFSRAWELGIGAMLAVAIPLLERIPNAVRPVLGWVGLAGMIASLWVISEDLAFPAPAAALPVLATALVIVAGTRYDRGQQQFMWPLTNVVSRYIGDVSYSLYLWHFPVIILGSAILDDTWLNKIWLAAAMLILSIYAYHLVEDPVRRSSWLEGDRYRSSRRGHHDNPFTERTYQYLAVSFMGVVTVTLLIGALRPPSVPEAAISASQIAQAEEGDGATEEAGLPPAQAELNDAVVTALQATSWPTLDPAMSDAIGSSQAPREVTDCGLARTDLDLDECAWGPSDAEMTVAVVGDSISMTYVDPLRDVLEPYNARVASVGTFACPFSVTSFNEGDAAERCDERKTQAVEAINELQPDLLFVAHTYVPPTPAGQSDRIRAAAWAEGLGGMLEQVSSSVGRVVLLSAPPGNVNLSCYTRQSSPADCAGEVDDRWRGMATAEQTLAAGIQGVWIDSSPWFCAFDQCPSFVDGVPVKSDWVHMTLAYGQRLQPALVEALQTAGVLPAV